MPNLYVNNGGTFTEPKEVLVKDAGVWTPAKTVYVKNAGVWSVAYPPSGTQTFVPTGSNQSFTVPNGVYKLQFTIAAGGGSGATGNCCDTSCSGWGGGGGGGGGWGMGYVNVTPGQVLTLLVGYGGARVTSSSSNGNSGQNSRILLAGSIDIYLQGGGAGQWVYSTAPAPGGTGGGVAASTGLIGSLYVGGAGGAGNNYGCVAGTAGSSSTSSGIPVGGGGGVGGYTGYFSGGGGGGGGSYGAGGAGEAGSPYRTFASSPGIGGGGGGSADEWNGETMPAGGDGQIVLSWGAAINYS